MENSKTIEETSKRVYEDAQAIRETAAKAANSMGDHATVVKEQVDKLKTDVVDHAAAHVENAKSKAKDAYNSLREYASEHPVAVLATGLVVGFLFAFSQRK